MSPTFPAYPIGTPGVAGGPPEVSIHYTIRALEAIEACYESARLGRQVPPG